MPIPHKKTMVCVTVQKTCERLIREGAALAGDTGLSVVHVVKPGGMVLGLGKENEALEYLFRKARDYGAEMDMLRSEDVTGTLCEFAMNHDIEYLVMGSAGNREGVDMAASLRSRLPSVRIFVV